MYNQKSCDAVHSINKIESSDLELDPLFKLKKKVEFAGSDTFSQKHFHN